MMTAAAAWWAVSRQVPNTRAARATGPSIAAGIASTPEAPPASALPAPEPRPATASPAVTLHARGKKPDAQSSPTARAPRDAIGPRPAQTPHEAARPRSHCDELLHEASQQVLSSEEIETWRKECT
jgi:hypothetical protein